MSGRLSAQSCPQVHRRDLSKNPTACGPCGQPSLLTTNTVAALFHLLPYISCHRHHDLHAEWWNTRARTADRCP
jgi:hypothetical protein